VIFRKTVFAVEDYNIRITSCNHFCSQTSSLCHVAKKSL